MSVGALPIHARDRARHRRERERMHAEVQAGLWRGASPVRRLSPEEIAAYEAELRERDRPRGPEWTTPMPGTRQAQQTESQTEEPMEIVERARSLRAELEQIEQQREARRREALQIADELEQQARALRELAGAVPVEVVQVVPPRPPPAPRQRPLDGERGYGRQRARIVAAMPIGEDVRAPQIARALGIPLATVGAELRALARRGEIQQTGRGLFRRPA